MTSQSQVIHIINDSQLWCKKTQEHNTTLKWLISVLSDMMHDCRYDTTFSGNFPDTCKDVITRDCDWHFILSNLLCQQMHLSLNCKKPYVAITHFPTESSARIWFPLNKRSPLNKKGRQSLVLTMCCWDNWHGIQAPQSYWDALGFNSLLYPIQKTN